MKITPIDIRQQQFGRRLRGLDPREVDSFLYLVSQELESAMKDNNRLKEELARTSRIVEEYRDRERTLKETMITAQKITDDIKESAQKEAEIIISRSEIQAEKIIQAANERLIKIIEDINETKRQRKRLHATMLGVIEAHRKLLHEVEEDKSEALFVNVEELRQRRARLHASIQETLEAHANLLGLDRDQESEELREETERLRRMRTNLISRLQGAIDTHAKLLEAREEAEAKTHSFQLEENLKVLKRPNPQPNQEKAQTAETESQNSARKEADNR